MQERGELVQDQDGWWIEGLNLDWDILPVRVEAVVAERIGRLAEPLQAALRTASVEGDLFTAEVVAQVHGTAAGELLRQMSRELDRRHHLIRSHSILRKQNQLLSRYRFRHTLFQKFLYNSIDEVERVHLHQQVGIALERFYGTEEEVNVGVEISPQLARHFQEAGLTDKAIHYSHRAGDRAVQLSAFQEGVVHLNNGLAMLESQPPSPDRDERELELQLSLGRAFIGKIPGPEWKGAINRASALCQRMGKTKQLCQVLGELSIHHYVRAEYRQAREFGEEALSLALQIGEPLLVALNHWHLGFILFGSGKYTAAQNHLEEIISFYNPQEHHHPFLLLRPSDPGASALAYSSCSLWCLGFPDQAAKRRDKAFKQARELEHPLTLADVLCYGGCVLNAMFRNISALQESAEELLRTSEELGFASWKANGTGYLGYSIAMTGRVEEGITKLQEAIALRKSRNSRCYLIGLLCALAECLAEAGRLDEGLTTLTEAEALLEKSDERLSESEVYRLQGELHHLRGDYDQAEASLRRAIGAARRQEAKSWELRSAMSLAHLWMDLEQPERAHKLLAQIYGWFTEGFDTLDMIEAGELLEEISERIN
jgi:adenylate cyclase